MSSSSRRPLVGSRRVRSPAAISAQASCSTRRRRSGLTLEATPQARPATITAAPLQISAQAMIPRISRSWSTSRPTASTSPSGRWRAIMRADAPNTAVGPISTGPAPSRKAAGRAGRLPASALPSRRNRPKTLFRRPSRARASWMRVGSVDLGPRSRPAGLGRQDAVHPMRQVDGRTQVDEPQQGHEGEGEDQGVERRKTERRGPQQRPNLHSAGTPRRARSGTAAARRRCRSCAASVRRARRSGWCRGRNSTPRPARRSSAGSASGRRCAS